MILAASWAAAGMAMGLFDSSLADLALGVTMIGMAGAVFNLARQSYLAEPRYPGNSAPGRCPHWAG